MSSTNITEFILLGFSCSRTSQLLLFTLILAFYTTILLGNFLIMVTVRSDPQLFQSPMYFFLANLSLLDLSLGSVAAPKLVTDLLYDGHTISYGGCMAQLFLLHIFGGAEMLLLTLMAYDRYVAICHPLRYTTVMDRQRCLRLITVCWTGGLLHSTFQMVVVARLSFCGPNVLDNFYCDIPQVIKLACTTTSAADIFMVVNSSLLTLPCFLSLLGSYITILATLCGHFRKGGRKALSTCTSHLIVVGLYYGPIVFVYIKPSSSSEVDKMVSVFYMVITPALNPLIYSLRNQEMKAAMRKMRSKCKLLLKTPREHLYQMSLSCHRNCFAHES